jgi:hypothetical protein
MSESVAELFSRNALERLHTDAEIDQIIEYLRQQRREQAEREAKGLGPRKTVKASQAEDVGWQGERKRHQLPARLRLPEHPGGAAACGPGRPIQPDPA